MCVVPDYIIMVERIKINKGRENSYLVKSVRSDGKVNHVFVNYIKKVEDIKDNNQHNWWRVILAILVLILVIGVGYVWLVNGKWPDWTGFGEYITPVVLPNQTFQPAKTLWDLMQLLIIPAILAGGAYPVLDTI
jgi:hypothetical protein